MGNIAVIDTETTWNNLVMSIGTVIADEKSFQLLDAKYHVLEPEYQIGGMYENVVFLQGLSPTVCTRQEAMEELCRWLADHQVRSIFAYNANFDRGHLPELRHFCWFDIMRLAAYRQYNPKIPQDAPCCATGRMKRGYGVEPMTHLLSGDHGYREVHNALLDAIDELKLMAMLGHPVSDYIPL